MLFVSQHSYCSAALELNFVKLKPVIFLTFSMERYINIDCVSELWQLSTCSIMAFYKYTESVFTD